MGEKLIHFSKNDDRTACAKWAGMVFEYTKDWTKVTCGSCKLEQPLEVPKEYFVPADVKQRDQELGESDPSLADLKAEHAARRLKAVRISEEFALKTAEYWTKVWRDAVILRTALEQESPGAPAGSKINKPQNRSERAVEANANGYALRHAPVNAVDIRTDPEETGGMMKTQDLSPQAKSALINVRPYQGAEVSCDPATFLELFQAAPALIGPNGGLTRAGTIARAKLVQAAEDAAFG